MVLYGGGLSTTVYAALRAIAGAGHGSCRWSAGPTPRRGASGLDGAAGQRRALYVLLRRRHARRTASTAARQFTVVQAAYRSAWTRRPTWCCLAIWAEQSGTW